MQPAMSMKWNLMAERTPESFYDIVVGGGSVNRGLLCLCRNSHHPLRYL